MGRCCVESPVFASGQPQGRGLPAGNLTQDRIVDIITLSNLIYANEADKCGHFSACDEPELIPQ